MPSFSKEILEDLEEWQLMGLLETCEHALREEERFLANVLNNVKIYRANIRSLKKKREDILKRMHETR